ncbi:Hpt domain-containing protein [Kordia sp. YSTF-M3]|uniref:Hpt domain-containing protein n=1 Tax=Kordia aestuariivivens TaxID=2759037 RepID=A0ABR7Q3S7_9FLAO|nr:Hpt domain-containing protein [Kordia aestuariivivens]MBC8753197.1 Hpt domain-containing protein [Kordia aestuariivivens]
MQLDTPNLSYIKELADGDAEFEASLITILKKELPKEKEAFIESVQNKNYQNSAEHVHKIKHKISILGLEKSYSFAISFEEELKKGNPKRYETFLSILQKMEEFLMKI